MRRVWFHGAWVSVTAVVAALLVSGAVQLPPAATPTPTSTATATATPGDCLASANCYPKPVNTGPGATGRPPGRPSTSTSCTTSPTSGQVLTDCLFTANTTITTTGAGATYRYSEFRDVVTHAGTGRMTVEYSNFGPTSACQTYSTSFQGADYTIRYSHFNSNVSEGPRVNDPANILIEENFMGPMCSLPDDHADGVQGFHGGTDVVIRHNTIDMRTAAFVTSPIFFADFSEMAEVRDNLVMGGGYSIRLNDDWDPDHGPWLLIRNRIVDGAWTYGPMGNGGVTFTADTCSDNRLVNIDADYNITAVGAVTGC